MEACKDDGPNGFVILEVMSPFSLSRMPFVDAKESDFDVIKGSIVKCDRLLDLINPTSRFSMSNLSSKLRYFEDF